MNFMPSQFRISFIALVESKAKGGACAVVLLIKTRIYLLVLATIANLPNNSLDHP